jgi:hypothetical protein
LIKGQQKTIESQGNEIEACKNISNTLRKLGESQEAIINTQEKRIKSQKTIVNTQQKRIKLQETAINTRQELIKLLKTTIGLQDNKSKLLQKIVENTNGSIRIHLKGSVSSNDVTSGNTGNLESLTILEKEIYFVTRQYKSLEVNFCIQKWLPSAIVFLLSGIAFFYLLHKEILDYVSTILT